jgi:uncharacterized protein (DUF736 family)
MAEQPKNPDELGALWVKQSDRGEYMTGTVNGVQVVVFRNGNKREGSNAPDWRVLKSKPMAGRTKPTRDAQPEYAADPEW